MIKSFILTSLILMFHHHADCQAADSVVLPNAVLYYYLYGSGEPLVLLSGGPGGSGHSMDHMVNELDKHYQIILFDQRGTGRSWTRPFDSTTINLPQAIEDLDKLRQKLRIPKLNLLGRSWGCMLAAAYISKYPSHVKLFISVCGGGLDTSIFSPINTNANILARFYDPDSTRYRYWSNPAIMKMDSAKAIYELTRLHMFGRVYDSSKIDLVINRQRSQGGSSSKIAGVMWETLPKYLHFSTANRPFHGKVLLIFGWQDPVSLSTISQYMQVFPHAQVYGVYQSGHFVERSALSCFIRLLINFFKTTSV